jgi:hypothetical protein
MEYQMPKVRIGHSSYSGANRLAVVSSKAAAVRELRERGFTRDLARSIINELHEDYKRTGNGYTTEEIPGTFDLVEIEFNPIY